VFERFTELARQAVVFAQEEARSLEHNYIGTEHLLLGLLREEEGVGTRALKSLGVSLEGVRGQVAQIIGLGDEVGTGQIPFTPRAKKVLELSLREALGLGHNYIGTEHLLLGLVAEGEGVACRILLDFGVTAETVREAVARALGGARVELHGPRRVQFPSLPRRVSSHAKPRLGLSTALVLGWLLFAVSLGIGILIGWAIWG